MIYFDNAATTHYKPDCVINAVSNSLKYFSANSGRSGHKLAVTCAKVIGDTREKLCAFVNSDNPDRVVFTKNCTEALNLGILGFLKKGDHAITTVHSHNSILRPLTFLKESGVIELTILKPDTSNLKNEIENSIQNNTRLVCLTHVSNVTGEELQIEDVGIMLKSKKISLLLDCAQSIGYIPIDFEKLNCDMLALPCHKGLHGIQGLGALIVNDETELKPILFGGTGTKSFDVNQPINFPEGFESGTLNTPAIFALGIALDWHNKNKETFSKKIFTLQKLLNSGLASLDNVKVYSKPNRSGICAFEILDIDSSLICDDLDSEFDIAVRGGLHCAPLMHKFLGTEKNGLVRASVGINNTIEDIDFMVSAVSKIEKKYS